METVLAFVIGGLYAAGLFLMLRRNLVRLILGLGLITNAANLLIFTVGGLTRGEPAIVSVRSVPEEGDEGDDVPQSTGALSSPSSPSSPSPLLRERSELRTPHADPLPQAMILTAIVIGFGVLAFALVLAYRVYDTVGSDDLDAMKATDR